MRVVVGRVSAASETGASSSSLLEGGRRGSGAGVLLFCGLLIRPSRGYTLWLSGGRRAAGVAEGRRGSELLRCCPQSAFPKSPLPHLLIERAHTMSCQSVMMYEGLPGKSVIILTWRR